MKYAACSGECFVLALVYIDRIIQSNPNFVVNSLNIHRLLITSIMLAAKFFDDQYFNNAYYAKVGGVPCHEVNSLEVEFLFMSNFTLFVTKETYRQYYSELRNHACSGTCDCSDIIPDEIVVGYNNVNLSYNRGGAREETDVSRDHNDEKSGTVIPIGAVGSSSNPSGANEVESTGYQDDGKYTYEGDDPDDENYSERCSEGSIYMESASSLTASYFH